MSTSSTESTGNPLWVPYAMPAIAPASKMHAHSCRESQGCRCAGTLHHHIQNTEGAGRASVLRLLASPSSRFA